MTHLERHEEPNRRQQLCPGPGRLGMDQCDRLIRVKATGLCKAHHEQMKSRGQMKPIEERTYSTGDVSCPGPGRDGAQQCERQVEAPNTGLCWPHHRQLRRNGNLKPVRRINTGEGPCEGPGPDGTKCGKPMHYKNLKLCIGHYGQHNRGSELRPLLAQRAEGEPQPCRFPGCRYKDAPQGEGLCQRHWRQQKAGKALTPLGGRPNRGNDVLLRDAAGNKLCPTCGEWKSIESFSSSMYAQDGLEYRCRRCHASIRMKSLYGIDIGRYEELLAEQGGGCGICGVDKPRKGYRFAIDHDHSCCDGTASCGDCIRGLLCQRCNQGLGLFQDRPERIAEALRYLERSRRRREQKGWDDNGPGAGETAA